VAATKQHTAIPIEQEARSPLFRFLALVYSNNRHRERIMNAMACFSGLSASRLSIVMAIHAVCKYLKTLEIDHYGGAVLAASS
jgi:hypothetical protein